MPHLHLLTLMFSILREYSDRDLSIQDEMSTQLDVMDIPEIKPIMELLRSGIQYVFSRNIV